MPFNLVASLIFLAAICHTFLTAKFRHWAHVAEKQHAASLAQRRPRADQDDNGEPDEVSFKGQALHFLGEVEAVFGIWVVVLAAAITCYFGWGAVLDYIGHRVNFTEPMFVVVIMAIAGTRPVLRFAQTCLRPAGQSILQRFFPDGVSPIGLLFGAAAPTLIMAVCFLVLLSARRRNATCVHRERPSFWQRVRETSFPGGIWDGRAAVSPTTPCWSSFGVRADLGARVRLRSSRSIIPTDRRECQ